MSDKEKETKETKKAERRAKRKAERKKAGGLMQEFKNFIMKGNVIDMAVGVIIGGAFKTIVTATVNILMSICTWGVPGGLSELVTILPAITSAQHGPKGQYIDETTFNALTESEQGQYRHYGDQWVTKASAVINWGDWINAIISFLTIALTLFVILKVFTYLKKKRAAYKEAMLEKHYQEHPEDRPAPVKKEKPGPTEVELLTEIRDALVAKKNENAAKGAK